MTTSSVGWWAPSWLGDEMYQSKEMARSMPDEFPFFQQGAKDRSLWKS
jgi:hypothetical protein